MSPWLPVGVLACGGGEPAPTPVAKAPSEPFHYAAAQVHEEAPPARFGGPLPATVEQLRRWPDGAPPRYLVVGRLCAGDAETTDALFTTFGPALAADPDPALAALLGGLVRYCPSADRCAPLVARWSASRAPGDKTLAALLVESCADAGPVMADPTTPDAVVLGHHGGWDLRRLDGYDARLGLALRRYEARTTTGARMAALRHGEVQDPRVVADLLALLERVDEPYVEAGAIKALRRQDGAEAAAAVQSWCAGKTDAWECKDGPPLVRGRGPEEAPAVAPEPAAVRLVALGVADAGLPSADVFAFPGHGGVGFDVETGQFPNEHDALLTRLWAAASPALPDAVFLEKPPEEPGAPKALRTDGGDTLTWYGEGGDGVYRLAGWAGGRRWDVVARDHGDWYDLDAVLGLLNTMARDLGQPVRFVSLPTGDQTAVVLGRDGEALKTAAAEGLVTFSRPSASAEDGKAFEREAVEQLLRDR